MCAKQSLMEEPMGKIDSKKWNYWKGQIASAD
jgi:hypothetical protein